MYRFPRDRLVFGPQQVLNRINQDADISEQVSLWDQRGSQVDLGTLLVIPIEESLIYVLPLYLRSQGGKIPQLKRVIAVYENQIAMAPTLDDALRTVFGDGPEQDGRAASKKQEATSSDEDVNRGEAMGDVAATAGNLRAERVPPFAAALEAYERADEGSASGRLDNLRA